MADFSWKCERGAGALAHITTLPSEFGIGNVGAAAEEFLDFLSSAGFSHWQICPLNPTGYGDSPYQAFSVFAGNPYLIDFAELRQLGLLEDSDLDCLRRMPEGRCDFGALYLSVPALVEKAFSAAEDVGIENLARRAGYSSFENFSEKNAKWLEGYALYSALKKENASRPWTEWSEEIKSFESASKRRLPDGVIEEADRVKFAQWIFFEQYSRLKARANGRGIEIFGDVPIFPAADCSDVWANPDLFDLSPEGAPNNTAGVGPDYFSPKGQMWGNPLYDWKNPRVYGFWKDRLSAAFEMYDVVRLDHFRGFADYWVIPANAKDASEGKMKKGPGIKFFEFVRREFPSQKFVAEDLGLLSKRAFDLRDSIKIPAMAVLQFAFGDSPKNPYLPHNTKTDCVYYTGTHDNDTARGWYESAPERARDEFRRYFRVSGDDVSWDMICAVLANHARLAVFPVQDMLSLSSCARFNTPGEPANNWTWRLTRRDFEELKNRAPYLRSMLELTDRLRTPPQEAGENGGEA